MSERDELANILPLGYRTPQDLYNNAFEAADAIMSSDWMARHDARVAAQALEEAALAVTGESTHLRDGATCRDISHDLRARAAEYREIF